MALVALWLVTGCAGAGADRAAGPSAAGVATHSVATTSGALAATSAAQTPTTRPPAPPADPVLARIPPAARAETERAAQLFAQYFFDTLNAAAMSADPALVDGLFGEQCKTCVAMQRSLRDLKASGQHHEKPTIRIVSVTTDSFVTERRVVLVAVDQASVAVLDRWGSGTSRTLADRGTFAMTLLYGHSHWVVARLQTVER
ncbi:DUF6318 family protein [Intrasporangium mesophilum]